MVRHGQLTADDLLNKDDVLGHRTGEGDRGVLVGPREAISGEALVLQRLGLGHQVLHRAGKAVGPQDPHQGGDARLHRGREWELRGAGMQSAFPAAAGQMDVLVNKTGDRRFPLGIDHLDAGKIRL